MRMIHHGIQMKSQPPHETTVRIRWIECCPAPRPRFFVTDVDIPIGGGGGGIAAGGGADCHCR